MPAKTPLTNHEKGMIQAWNEEGISNREIARRLGISDSTMRYNLKKLEEDGTMEVHGQRYMQRREGSGE